MSAVFNNQLFDLIPAQFSGYKPSLLTPKVRFQATAGYVHQRDRYPSLGRKVVLETFITTQGEYNMIRAWIDYVGSASFWYVLPTSLAPRPDGQVIPRGILCRIIDEEIPDEPVFPNDGFCWRVRITLESIGPEVE